MFHMNNYIIAGAVLVAVLAGSYVYLPSATPVESGPITIGVVAPLSGDAAAYGEPVRNAITLAVDEINSTGGIDGRPITVVYEDGKCTGKDAASAAQKLVSIDRVRYIVGPVCSAEAFGMVPVTSAARVFVLSPGSSAPKLAGASPYFMRAYPNDNITGVALADHLAKSYTSAAILTESTDYGLGIKEVFVAQAEKNGMRIVRADDFTTGTTDFRAILTQLKAASPDVIFINPQTSANLLRVVKQVRELGITTPIATAVFNDPQTVGAGPVVEGMTIVSTPELKVDGMGAVFLASYKKSFGELAYPFLAGAAYDNVHLIKQAIESVGDDTTKVQKYLHSLEAYTGTLGTYHFDQNGDIVGLPAVVQRIQQGRLVTVSQ
jgi:branched-chain amino acid transport system substrate-binding protein